MRTCTGRTKDDGSPVHSWDCDHYFYHSQGYAHVMYHMMQAIEREYKGQLKDDPVLKTLFDDAINALGQAAVMKPLIVLNGSPDGLFANHRRNLDAYINEARQKMYVAARGTGTLARVAAAATAR